MTTLAPSQLPEPMRDGGLLGVCQPTGCVGIVVGVVLIGDVHVGTGLDLVAQRDRPVTDDVRAASDDALAAQCDTTGELSISCSPLMPAVRQTFGPISVSSPMER